MATYLVGRRTMSDRSKPTPDAFLSYTRFNDRYDGGKISTFRERLSDAMQAVTGRPFHIFQDVDGIGLGENWRSRLNIALGDARFFIPILTPSFFGSEACRGELELSAETGKTYRLLSEAEWEYACRAGTRTPFWTGGTISSAQANYDGNYTYGAGEKGEYRKQTTPVDTFPANPWGLHDVHGNVWEWVEDCWNDTYEGAPAGGGPWLSGDCNRRVLRGGSWLNGPGGLRSAFRNGGDADGRVRGIGFRVARTLTPPRTVRLSVLPGDIDDRSSSSASRHGSPTPSTPIRGACAVRSSSAAGSTHCRAARTAPPPLIVVWLVSGCGREPIVLPRT